MKRFYEFFRIATVLFILPLLLGCIAKMTVKETAHYKLHENIVLTPLANMGIWTKTDIDIPKGAIVAVMVKGEIWHITDPSKWHWPPYRCLEFKVGKEWIVETAAEATVLPLCIDPGFVDINGIHRDAEDLAIELGKFFCCRREV